MKNTSQFALILILLALVKKVQVKVLFFVSLFFISSSINLSYPISNSDNEIKLRDLLLKIAEKKRNIRRQQAERNHLLYQLNVHEKRIAAIENVLYKKRKKLSTLTKEIMQLNKNITDLQQQKQMKKSLLIKDVNTSFQLKHQKKRIELLANADQWQRKKRILFYYSYLNKARKQNIIKLQETVIALIEQKYKKQKKQLIQKKNLLKKEQEKRNLYSIQHARKRKLSFLEFILKKDQKNLLIMKDKETQLRTKINKVKQKIKVTPKRRKKVISILAKQRYLYQKDSTYYLRKDEGTLMQIDKGLSYPLSQHLWPVHGQILHYYGDNISDELRWKGIVINAIKGTKVKAISSGRILLATWLQGYGLLVIIDHGQGDMSLYGYNQTALVHVGQQVQSGQPIALVGGISGEECSSVYFEIRRQGKTVNPQPWLGFKR